MYLSLVCNVPDHSWVKEEIDLLRGWRSDARAGGLSSKLAAVLIVGSVLVSACSGSGAEPPADIAADSLIVSVDEVEQIASFKGFTQDQTMRANEPHPDSRAVQECKAVYDQGVIFGGGPKEFRSVSYGGTTGSQIKGVAEVVQNIGVYQQAELARSAFDRLMPALRGCFELHIKNYDFAVGQPDPATIVLTSNHKVAIAYRLKASVLTNVVVIGLQHPDLVTRGVLDAITERIQ